MKKLIAFDLDGTLTPSKSPIPDLMSQRLGELLDHYDVCVISGGRFEQYERQLLINFKAGQKRLERLHLLPTSGTRYFAYKHDLRDWQEVYAEDIAPDDRRRIVQVIEKAVDELGLREKQIYGELVEDRGSQVTFSAYGQHIVRDLGAKGQKMKEEWDPDHQKLHALRDYVVQRVPGFEVRVGGVSSLDVTRAGVDKAYGLQKFMSAMSYEISDVVYIGDRFSEYGNDYPVKAMGVNCIEIAGWQETAAAAQAILYVT